MSKPKRLNPQGQIIEDDNKQLYISGWLLIALIILTILFFISAIIIIPCTFGYL